MIRHGNQTWHVPTAPEAANRKRVYCAGRERKRRVKDFPVRFEIDGSSRERRQPSRQAVQPRGSGVSLSEKPGAHRLRMTDSGCIALGHWIQVAADDRADLRKFPIHGTVSVVFPPDHVEVNAETQSVRP